MASAVELILRDGPRKAMNRFHASKPKGKKAKSEKKPEEGAPPEG